MLVAVLRFSTQDATPTITDGGSGTGTYAVSGGHSGPPSVEVTPSSSEALEIQLIASSGYAMNDFYTGLTSYADIHVERVNDLCMACSVRRITADSDLDNVSPYYQFAIDGARYVTVGLTIEAVE